MKVKALWSFVHGARRKKGDVFDIDDRTAKALIQKKLVEQYVVPVRLPQGEELFEQAEKAVDAVFGKASEQFGTEGTDQPDSPPAEPEPGTSEATDQPDAPPAEPEPGTGETTDQPDAPPTETEPTKAGKKK